MAGPTDMRCDSCVSLVGNRQIDGQHRHISRLIVGLVQASEGHGSDTADLLVEHLADFMRLHFRTEEDILARIGYPGLQKHAQEHRACLAVISGFVDKLHDRNCLDIKAVAAFATGWLEHHTATSDQLFVPFLARLEGCAAQCSPVEPECPAVTSV